jgi:type VI protein secretion system component VasK
MRRAFPVEWWIAIAAIFVVCVLTLSWCNRGDRLKDADNAATVADGRTKASQDASQVRDQNDEANAATKAEVKDATDELRATDPADRDRVFRDRVCRLNPGACSR